MDVPSSVIPRMSTGSGIPAVQPPNVIGTCPRVVDADQSCAEVTSRNSASIPTCFRSHWNPSAATFISSPVWYQSAVRSGSSKPDSRSSSRARDGS